MSALEQSFVDLCAKHDLTVITVGMHLGLSEGSRFTANVHWIGFSTDGIPCTSGCGTTISEALANALTRMVKERTNPAVAIELADEALQVAA